MKFFAWKKNIRLISIFFISLFIILIAILLLQILAMKKDIAVDGKEDGPDILVEIDKNDNSEEGFKKARAIDGVFVSEDLGDFYPKAVTVENNIDARPQSGLDKANFVIEAPVEGGITRFVAIFASEDEVREIGPVRSARPYFIDWATEFDGLYAHVGGSPEALDIIKKDKNFVDLDQYFMSQYYWRSSKRPRPHNVYTSTELLNNAADYFSLNKAGFESWIFKDELSVSDRPEEGGEILIDFSTYANKVEWKYDREANEYLRYQAGERHLMKDGSEIRAKNVVIQKTSVVSIDSEDRKRIKTIGEGEAVVFFDGSIMEGMWKKEFAGKRTRFYDEEGDEIKFNRGATWVEVIGGNVVLKY